MGPLSTPQKAPVCPSPGMSSQELADYTSDYVRAVSARIVGIGAKQYEDRGEQRFESLPIRGLLDMALEELQDIAAYSAMLAIRLQWLKEKL